MILVDTGVIADIFTRDPDWFQWSSSQIERAASQGPLAYNSIVFAELAVKFDTQRELETYLNGFWCSRVWAAAMKPLNKGCGWSGLL